MDIELLSEKIFALLKGNGLKLKIYDTAGAETTDPRSGRRFFAAQPNIMVTLNTDNNSIEFSKGAGVSNEVDTLHRGIKKLADEFLMNSKIKIFGKSIRPKDYSYQAKMQKDSVMENTSVNHLVLAKVFKELDYAAAMTADAIAENIPGADLNEVQKALNRLVQDGKVSVSEHPRVGTTYSKKMEEAVGALYEGFSKMFGSRRTSRQQLENVKLIIRHKDDIDESVRGARARKISSIFLECNGERLRFPYTHLTGARAMAQHLAHGGTMTDKIGTYIAESTGKLIQLQSFNRYATANQLINEHSASVIDSVKENISSLKDELTRLTKPRTYETAKARIETLEPSNLAEEDLSSLKELFTVKKFDEKFETVLPVVSHILKEKDAYRKRIEEAAAGIVAVRNDVIDSTPVFEFASEHSRLAYKLNELALRITGNPELSEFVSSVGNKLYKNQEIDAFESAIVSQVLENAVINKLDTGSRQEIKESADLELFFEQFDLKFL